MIFYVLRNTGAVAVMDMKGAKSESAPNMLNSTRLATRPHSI